MKKMALIVVITALSIFMTASLASAGDGHCCGWKHLNGDYAMTASGGCFHSTAGFDETPIGSGLYVPKANSGNVTWGAVTAATAFWTFEPDGTGSVWSGENYVIDFPPGNTVAPVSANRMNPFGFTFTYKVTRYGDITVTPDLPYSSYLPVLEGTVSEGKNTITLVSMNKLGGSPKGPAVCSVTRILIKTKDLPEPDVP